MQPQSMQVYRDIFSQKSFSERHTNSQATSSSSEYSVSTLDLFYVPPKQTSVEKGTWFDVHPIVSVSDTGPIEFEFEGKQQ